MQNYISQISEKYVILDFGFSKKKFNSVNMNKNPCRFEHVICSTQAQYFNYWAMMIFN